MAAPLQHKLGVRPVLRTKEPRMIKEALVLDEGDRDPTGVLARVAIDCFAIIGRALARPVGSQ
jgi:hypothetical protein